MSDQPPNIPPPPPLPPPQRSGCVTALLVVIGIALLFPGLCFGLLISAASGHIGREEVTLLVICGLVAFGGIGLIIWAFRRP